MLMVGAMQVENSVRFRVILLCTSALLLIGAPLAVTPVRAQGTQAALNLPAQDLGLALTQLADQAGLRLIVASDVVAGKRSNALSGSYSAPEALGRLLAGTGLNYRFTGANTVTIRGPDPGAEAVQPAEGAVVLDTVSLFGGGNGAGAHTPYETPAARSHIDQERLERYRGTGPADMFRGTPGVMSGDARNSAGAIDVNLRGLQGAGRVKVSVDDAENAVTVSHGYQGQSNRSYVDPDFIAGIEINKGLDVASRGAAGAVAMRTVRAGDVVRPGEAWAIRLKAGFGTNSSTPVAEAAGGYRWPTPARPQLEESATGLDRPGALEATSFNASILAAVNRENWDFLIGYAARKQGNYHAGTRKGGEMPANPVLDNGSYVNAGFTNYRPGEEILNTQLATRSLLIKAGFRLPGDQTLEFSYNGYRSEGGYFMSPAGAMADITQSRFGATTDIKLDTLTARYRWNPADNDLIDLRVNGWMTWFQFLNQPRAITSPGLTQPQWPGDIGLPVAFRTGTNTLMWGIDVSNRSRIYPERGGELELDYGLSFIRQDVRLGRYADLMSIVPPSQGLRDEVGAHFRAKWTPLDWLTLNAGLRYSSFRASGPEQRIQVNATDWIVTGPPRSAAGFSPSIGLTLAPHPGIQVYANYASALRLPNLRETVGTFTIADSDLRPERLKSLDIGVNVMIPGILHEDDIGMLKFGWFDWKVDDYISRAIQSLENGSMLRIHNIHGASFSGFELAGRYKSGGFSAELAANYFTGMEFCSVAGACGTSLYGDYATNHVPPKYMLDLSLSQKLMQDRLTIGGRFYRVGPRAIAHGAVTQTGASAFITQIRWQPHTLIDAFAEYKLGDNTQLSFRVENLTDRFYVDPLGLLPQPGPGRTFHFSLTHQFGGGSSDPEIATLPRNPLRSAGSAGGKVNWTGFYAGLHGGFSSAGLRGAAGILDAAAGTFGGRAGMIAASEGLAMRANGAIGGVQAGYNRQLANGLVVGVEGSLSRSWAGGRQDNLALDDDRLADGLLQSRYHSRIDWSGALRGRVGYAFDNGLMLFASGGIAVLGERLTRDQNRIADRGWSNPGGTVSRVADVEESRKTRVGLTGGIGVEYALNERWSVSAEYSNSVFKRRSHDFANARAGASTDYLTRELVGMTPNETPIYRYVDHEGGYKTVNGRRVGSHIIQHNLKVGLNFRF